MIERTSVLGGSVSRSAADGHPGVRRLQDRGSVHEAEDREGRDEDARAATREARPLAPASTVAVTGRGDEVDLLAETPAVVRHDHDEPMCETRDIRSASRAGELHFRMAAIPDRRGVEVPVDVDLGAPDCVRVLICKSTGLCGHSRHFSAFSYRRESAFIGGS